MVALLLTPLAATPAQQTCLTATPTARAAITAYLQDPDERAWLDAHGITATSADQLTPLADAIDLPICRRMDSTLKMVPAYYLRAGSLVIATTAQPVNLRPGVIGSRNDLGNDLFVFNSAGRWIHSPGDPESPALRITKRTSLRAWDTSATALAKEIERSRGAAHIALKETGSPRSMLTGVRAAVTRRTIDEGLALLRARGVVILDVYRHLGMVHVKIDGATAAGLFGHPLIDFIEPAQPRYPI
jgi:hypothetical protein